MVPCYSWSSDLQGWNWTRKYSSNIRLLGNGRILKHFVTAKLCRLVSYLCVSDIVACRLLDLFYGAIAVPSVTRCRCRCRRRRRRCEHRCAGGVRQ